MKVMQSFIEGKAGNPDTCEDGLVIKEHFIAVVDGVTAKSEHLWDGSKSGCYARKLLCSYMEENPVEDMGDLELLEHLNSLLHEAAEGKGALRIQDYPRAAIIFYQEKTGTICSYGDCQCLINGKKYDHGKLIDDMNACVRGFYLEYALMHGSTLEELKEHDVGRDAIKQNLLMQFSFENQDGRFGYPVLNGMGINPSLVVRHHVCDGDMVVLASDGYPELSDTLEDSEQRLKKIIQDDPLCFRRYPSTKGIKPGSQSFDDRTYCSFKA